MLLTGREIWVLIILASLGIDFLVEYPNIIHPVAWTGKIIKAFDDHRLFSGHAGEFVNGMLSVIVAIAVWSSAIYLIHFLPLLPRIAVTIFILKSTFSIGGLVRSVRACETGELEKLRRNTGLIVSRNVENLDMDHLYSAAFESGAENLVDSVISPLFYFALFGLYGAVIFRIVNTADAMIGYRNKKYEFYGKFAARMDDVMNFIPSRLLALIILLLSPKRVISNLKKYRKLKLNGMYSMATMAALFRVRIEKIGYYYVDGPSFPDIGKLKMLERAIYGISYSLFLIISTVVYFYGAWWS